MTNPWNTDHDILARIAALLLSLAMLAERAASSHPARRRSVLSVLLPAHRAALTVLDAPLEDLDSLSSERALARSGMDDRTCQGLLEQLAGGFRLIAAVLLHACMNEGRPSSRAMRYVMAHSRPAPVHPARFRFLRWIGFVHDTS